MLGKITSLPVIGAVALLGSHVDAIRAAENHWHFEIVDHIPPAALRPSLALSSAGQPVIYYPTGNTDTAQTRVAQFTGSSWGIEVVTSISSGGVTMSGLPGSSQPTFAYSFGGTDGVVYAAYDGAQWNLQSIPARAGCQVYVG